MAETCGVSTDEVRRWRAGEGESDAGHLGRFAHLLHDDLPDLLGYLCYGFWDFPWECNGRVAAAMERRGLTTASLAKAVTDAGVPATPQEARAALVHIGRTDINRAFAIAAVLGSDLGWLMAGDKKVGTDG